LKLDLLDPSDTSDSSSKADSMSRHRIGTASLLAIAVAVLSLGSLPASHAQPGPEDGTIRAVDSDAAAEATREDEPENAERETRIEIAEETTGRLAAVKDELARVFDKVVISLPLFLIALLVFVIFWFLGRLITSTEFLFRWIRNRFGRDLFQQFMRGVIVVVGLILALEIMNATALVGAALGAAGVVGLALGFAFKDLVENYIAGVMLSTRQPFAPNDLVEINQHEGKIIRLTSRATILLTLDGNHLRIPNAQVYKGIIVNYTRNPKRRFAVAVGVGVNEDLVEAQRLGISILENMQAVLADPPPQCLIEALGDSSVSLSFYAWVEQNTSDYLKSRSEGIRLIKTAFDDAEIEMPEPIYRIVNTRPETSPGPSGTTKTLPAAQLDEQDTSAERYIDEQIDAERRAEGDDLLDDSGKME
jgi:small-conductance mechanosensitive channel